MNPDIQALLSNPSLTEGDRQALINTLQGTGYSFNIPTADVSSMVGVGNKAPAYTGMQTPSLTGTMPSLNVPSTNGTDIPNLSTDTPWYKDADTMMGLGSLGQFGLGLAQYFAAKPLIREQLKGARMQNKAFAEDRQLAKDQRASFTAGAQKGLDTATKPTNLNTGLAGSLASKVVRPEDTTV